MTLAPDALTAADADAVRAAGVSDEMLEDAIHVCAMFNVIARIADALEFEILSREGFAAGGVALLKRGYG